MRKLACGLLFLAAMADPAAAQAPDKTPPRPLEIVPSPPPSRWPTLKEARTISQCDAVWAQMIATVNAANPEQDAEQQIAASDFTLKSRTRQQIAARDFTLKPGRRIETHVDGRIVDIVPVVFRGPAGVQCKLPVRHVEAFAYIETTAPGVVVEARIVPSIAGTWCGRALLVLKEDYSIRFNRHVVDHRSYPHKDVCSVVPTGIGRLPDGRISDRPTPDMIPLQVPDIATAARFGLTERVAKFIADGASLGRRDVFGFDALMWSVVRDYRAVFDLVVAAGGTSDFCGALKAAVEYDRVEAVAPLARRCAPVERLALLEPAVKRGKLTVVSALIDAEPALQLGDADETVPVLRGAVSAGRADLARLLVGRLSAAQWEKSRQGLLGSAVWARNLGMVRLLLERGADPTPLLPLAVRRKAHEVVRTLGEHGADPNAILPPQPRKLAATDVRIDPLGRQISSGKERLSRLADPPIFEALHPLLDSRMVDLLLELGANPNVRDGSGRTPLIVAITIGQIYGKKAGAPWIERFVPQRLIEGQEDWEHRGVEPVRALLAKGADVALADSAGMTALHHAARSDYATEIARILLAHGADINARDKAGKTPPDHALELGLVRMPELLEQAGARRGGR